MKRCDKELSLLFTDVIEPVSYYYSHDLSAVVTFGLLRVSVVVSPTGNFESNSLSNQIISQKFLEGYLLQQESVEVHWI